MILLWQDRSGGGLFADLAGRGRYTIRPRPDGAGHLLRLNSEVVGSFTTADAAKARASVGAAQLIAAAAEEDAYFARGAS